MNERIKKLRKELDMTQQEFAECLGMKRNSIAQIELGRNTSDQTIRMICKTFNVNEEWLRTGTLPMFNRADSDGELKDAISKILPDEPEEFKRRFSKLLASLSDKQWEILKDKAVEYAREEPEPPVEPDLAAQVAELQRQNQELLARIAAIEQEDAMRGLGGGVIGSNVG